MSESTVHGKQIAPASIPTAAYAALSVDNAALGLLAVQTGNIGNQQVTQTKLASGVYVASVKETITYTGHGISLSGPYGQMVYRTSGGYAKSQATYGNSEVSGVVESAPDANTLVIVVYGYILLTGRTLTDGAEYGPDPTTAGNFVTPLPSSTNQVARPVFRAISTTEAFVQISPIGVKY